MKKHLLPLLFCCGALLTACQQHSGEQKAPLTPEQKTANDIDSLKRTAAPGDLIVRLGDDFLSYYIKFVNETDQSFSHAGLIAEKDGKKMVVHIAPDSATNDGITYTPIDSFINPAKTLQCALYRYTIPQQEKDKALAAIETYRQSNIGFDRRYDLTTDDKLYCSEMISKAFAAATQNRLHFKTMPIPPRLEPMMLHYFKGQAPPKTILSRQVMTIDNLYRVPECSRLMLLTLKILPGQ